VGQPPSGQALALDVSGSVIAGGYLQGIALYGGSGSVDATTVSGIKSEVASKQGGVGVAVTPWFLNGMPPAPGDRPSFTFTRSRVTSNLVAGLTISTSDATLDGVLIDSIVANEKGEFGDGLILLQDANVTATHSRFASNQRAGMVVFGSKGAISSTTSSCNLVDLDAEDLSQDQYTNQAIPPMSSSLTSTGTTECGCNDKTSTCTVSTKELKAPGAVKPLGEPPI
jgi:hypothetical protein